MLNTCMVIDEQKLTVQMAIINGDCASVGNSQRTSYRSTQPDDKCFIPLQPWLYIVIQQGQVTVLFKRYKTYTMFKNLYTNDAHPKSKLLIYFHLKRIQSKCYKCWKIINFHWALMEKLFCILVYLWRLPWTKSNLGGAGYIVLPRGGRWWFWEAGGTPYDRCVEEVRPWSEDFQLYISSILIKMVLWQSPVYSRFYNGWEISDQDLTVKKG